jgi:predicted porin
MITIVAPRRVAAFVKQVSVASAVVVGLAASANAADMPIPTKAEPLAPAAPAGGPCASVPDFFLTSCKLSAYGVQLYGIVDVGATYQTHGSPFDRNFPTGASYLLGAGGSAATNRTPGFGLAPNAMSQSLIGLRWREPVGGGWEWIGQGELAFDPYSLLLANAPQALQDGIHNPQNQQAQPYDSSRWGWLAGQIYTGVNNPTFGTLTFGRMNSLLNDSLTAYDPFGAAYGFSMVGYSGKYAGAGATEEARWTTAIKYRLNIGDFRFAAMGQPLAGSDAGYNAYNPNNGAVAGQIGSDIRGLGPGVFSWDTIFSWERDAVNISALYPGQILTPVGGGGGWPITFPGGPLGSGLKATISDNTSIAAMAKYSFGSWAEPVGPGGAPVASGIPLTLYASYQYINLASPSNTQTTSLLNDGFTFNFVNTAASVLSANGTTIANNAFNAMCGSGKGCTSEIFQFVYGGFKYGITKDLDLISAWYHEWQDTFVIGVPQCSQGVSAAASNSRCAGYMDAVSVAFDWRFLPKWDWYIGTMYSAANGGIANGDIARNNLATTTGIRFRF